jgi:indole-3-glycerol phosphate synthase
LKQWGFNGALVGESLMRSPDPEKLLGAFISGVNSVDPT